MDKKLEKREIFQNYLMYYKADIGLVLLGFCIFLSLAFLYNIEDEFVIYAISIGIVMAISSLIIHYNSFYKKHRMLEQQIEACLSMKPEEGKEVLKLMGEGDNLIEQDYQKLLEGFESMGEKQSLRFLEEYQSKQDFFTMWAHQIKTPIAALQVLLQSEDTLDMADCRQELFKIDNYVGMALGYLRSESMENDLRIERYSLENMIKQIVKKYATVFIYRHLTVELKNLDCSVLTDEKWLIFALEQVISNALKYTMEGGICMEACRTKHGVELKISDTGMGIRQEDLPRIFEKGFTGYNGRIDKKASGLGLYLCKGILEKLGHSIRIDSKEGEGTTVFIGFDNKDDLSKNLSKQ